MIKEDFIPLRLAKCAVCGTDAMTLVCLPYRAPRPGTGWGCLVCGLKLDGAVQARCTAHCSAKTEEEFGILAFDGFPFTNGEPTRYVALTDTTPFRHDPDAHEAIYDVSAPLWGKT